MIQFIEEGLLASISDKVFELHLKETLPLTEKSQKPHLNRGLHKTTLTS